MGRSARDFLPAIVRQGNVVSNYTFTLRCSKCGGEDAISGVKNLPDDVVAKKFKQRGWITGKRRDWDRCPECLGVGVANQLASRFRVTSREGPVPSPAELADRAAEEARVRGQETERILDRHLGPVSSDYPRKNTPPPKPILVDRVEVIHPPTIEQALIDTARESAQMRAAMELLLEQHAQCEQVLLQQATALGHLTTTLARATEALSVQLRELTGEMKTNTELLTAGLKSCDEAVRRNTDLVCQSFSEILDELRNRSESVVPPAPQVYLIQTGTQFEPVAPTPQLVTPVEPDELYSILLSDPIPAPEPEAPPLPAQIRAARQAKGMTQQQVADRLGVSGSAVTQWERGVHAPKAEKLHALCSLLGIRQPKNRATPKAVADLRKRPASKARRARARTAAQ